MSNKVLVVTDETAQEIIKEGIVVLDFWAEWCGPCGAYSQIIEETAQELENVVFGKLNVDDNSELSTKFQIRNIPTTIIFEDGEMKEKLVGLTPKNKLKEEIQRCTTYQESEG